MKIKNHQEYLQTIFVAFLSVFVFCETLYAQDKEINRDVQEQLQILISNNEPNDTSVKEAQELLVKLGYDPGPIDGMLGTKTQNALKKWGSSSESNVPKIWLKPKKMNVSSSGWKCVSRKQADAHKGPVICGNRVQRLMIEIGSSGNNYYSNGWSIPRPTKNCEECEIYIR